MSYAEYWEDISIHKNIIGENMNINKKELHELFQGIKQGSRTAFEVLYKRYNQLVYKIAFSILKNKENSEDVMQNVFTKIFELPEIKLPDNSNL